MRRETRERLHGHSGVKRLRVGASVGADCSRMPSIDRYRATATAPERVLRQHGMKDIDTPRDSPPYGSEGWGFESLRARSVLRRNWTPPRCRGRSAFLDEPAGQRPVAAFQSGRRGRPEGCSVQLICEGMEPLGWRHPYIHPYIAVGMGCGRGMARVVFTVVDEQSSWFGVVASAAAGSVGGPRRVGR